MAPVQTIRGPIDSAQLGRTYMHEHVFVLTADVQQNFPGEWGDEQSRVDDAVRKLSALNAQGVNTIVDPTVIGLGRYIPRIRLVAERLPDLNIVAATGCYTYNDVPFFFAGRYPAATGTKADPMVGMFIRDIVEGIADTGVKAGMLKCAIGELGATDGVTRVMRAVAQAHLATDIPITVHTDSIHERGLDVKRVMVDEEGVAPERIVLGHTGDTIDIDHISELADMGFVLGFDRFGINVGPITFQTRAATLMAACRRGLADQIVLSQDACCYIDWFDPALIAAMTEWNYLHLGDRVLPYVREHGVTEDQITTMLVDVPRRVFEQSFDG